MDEYLEEFETGTLDYEAEYNRLIKESINKEVIMGALIEQIKTTKYRDYEDSVYREKANQYDSLKEDYNEQRSKYLYSANELLKARQEIHSLGEYIEELKDNQKDT